MCPVPDPEVDITTVFVTDSLKMLRETLCVAQTAISHTFAGADRRTEHVERLGRLIQGIDRQRPLGPDGKHGERHTPTCGCPDAVVDPTTVPDPRRWGRAIRGEHRGERVYWDASLHARGENEWTNVARTRRYSADMVQGDREVHS